MKSVMNFCLAVFIYFTVSCAPTSVSSSADISASITSSAQGCGNFIVYRSDSLKSKWVVVDANLDSLSLSESPKEFDLKNESSFLFVHYDFYLINKDGTKQLNFIYCNDVLFNNSQMPQVFKAIDGYAHIFRSPIETNGFFKNYRVTVKLRSVHFVDSLGKDTVFLKALTIDSVHVGWLPG